MESPLRQCAMEDEANGKPSEAMCNGGWSKRKAL